MLRWAAVCEHRVAGAPVRQLCPSSHTPSLPGQAWASSEVPQGLDQHSFERTAIIDQLVANNRTKHNHAPRAIYTVETLPHLTRKPKVEGVIIPQPRDNQVCLCLSLIICHIQDVQELDMFSRLPPLTVTRRLSCLQVSLTEADMEPPTILTLRSLPQSAPSLPPLLGWDPSHTHAGNASKSPVCTGRD